MAADMELVDLFKPREPDSALAALVAGVEVPDTPRPEPGEDDAGTA